MDFGKALSFKKNSPTEEKDIKLCENSIGQNIPEIYKEFLRETNGMDLDTCVLYDTDCIVEMYNVHEFAKYAPNYLSIGNDNGGRELIIKSEKNTTMCGFLDAGAIGTAEPDEWFDFASWLKNGCEIIERENGTADIGVVEIINLPSDKLKFLVETKKVFSLSVSASELLKSINSLPYVILKDVYMSKAQILIRQTHYPECYRFSANDKH